MAPFPGEVDLSGLRVWPTFRRHLCWRRTPCGETAEGNGRGINWQSAPLFSEEVINPEMPKVTKFGRERRFRQKIPTALSELPQLHWRFNATAQKTLRSPPRFHGGQRDLYSKSLFMAEIEEGFFSDFASIYSLCYTYCTYHVLRKY